MEMIKNEMELKLGEQVILVRATFDALQKFERAVGGIGAFIAPITKTGFVNLSDAALLIYYTQATENAKQLSKQECFDLVMSIGIEITKDLMIWIAKLTAGNKKVDQAGDAEKKV